MSALLSQEEGWTCIPACVRTLLSLAGRAVPGEAELKEILGERPYSSFAVANGLGRYISLGIDVDVDLMLAFASVHFGAVVVGKVAYDHAISEGLESVFASLHTGHHAVVVLGIHGDEVQYFDPYFPAEKQPLRVPLVTFVRDWWVSGVFVVDD